MPDTPERPTHNAGTKKAKPTKPLPTDRIAYQKQLDVLRAYAIAAESGGGRAVTPQQVANIVKIAPSSVPLVYIFFGEIGLLQRVDGGYLPSPEVVAFNRAYAWNQDTASHKLGPAVQGTWFGQVLMPRLAFRPMDEAEALTVLGEAAGATPEYKAQLALLISYMETAGLVEREGTLIKKTATAGAVVPEPAPQVPAAVATAQPPAGATVGVSSTYNRAKGPGVQFQINVDVDMKEMAGWSADRISAFFAGVAQVLTAKGAIEKID